MSNSRSLATRIATVVFVVFLAGPWALACSGVGNPITTTNGSAGEGSFCSRLQADFTARCGSTPDADRDTRTCEEQAADAKCGGLLDVLGRCIEREVARRRLCRDDAVPGCETEVGAYVACLGPATSVVSEVSDPNENDGQGSQARTCSNRRTCLNGTCRCAAGPHEQEVCCDTDDCRTNTSARPDCHDLCMVCE